MKPNEPVLVTFLVGIAASVLTSYCTWYCAALGMAAQNSTDKAEMQYRIDRLQRDVYRCRNEIDAALRKLEEKYGVLGDGNMPRTGWYCAMPPPKAGDVRVMPDSPDNEVFDGTNWVKYVSPTGDYYN